MIIQNFKLNFLIFIFTFLISSPSQALTVSGNDLVENANLYDGKTVEYQGEVVGDIMARGDHVWLNVNDGTLAIGIWAKKELAQGINLAGSYEYIGDRVLVQGVFHRACAEHGGDLDIHAEKISLVAPGKKIEHDVKEGKIVIAVLLLIAILAVILVPMIIKKKKS
jgi:hypothetical protein